MFPYFVLFGKVIGLYTIFSLVGIFCTGIFCCREATRCGQDSNDMITLLLVTAVFTIAGGHLLYAATSYPLLAPTFATPVPILSKGWLERIVLLFGGSVFYGGLIGGMVAGLCYLHKKRLPKPQYADILAPGIPLFHAFGRIGCFFGGCCYGVSSRIGFVFTHSLVESANGVRRFPIQLAEALFNFLLFYCLFSLLRRKKARGYLLHIYLVLYSIGRFVLEYWRGDIYRGAVWGVSTSQFISILIFVVAGGLMLLRMQPKQSKPT